jgi:hypothetical protein
MGVILIMITVMGGKTVLAFDPGLQPPTDHATAPPNPQQANLGFPAMFTTL